MEQIDQRGGLVEAVKSGWVNRMIEEEALKRQKAIESGAMKLVGINDMVIPQDKEQPLPIHQTTKASTKEQVRRTKEIKKRRDNKKVKKVLQRLVEEDQKGDINLVPTMIEACKEYATIGEIWGVLREGRGLPYDPFEMIESPFKD